MSTKRMQQHEFSPGGTCCVHCKQENPGEHSCVYRDIEVIRPIQLGNPACEDADFISKKIAELKEQRQAMLTSES